MKITRNIVFTGLTLIFFGLTLWFFGVHYHGHIHYNEQYQLFQTSWEYFLRTVSFVGGMSNYIARFLTSFYLFSWVGAGILAILITLVAILMYLLVKKSESVLVLGFSFIPSIILLCYFGDECAMLSTAVAFVMALLIPLFVDKIGNNLVRLVMIFVVLPVMYFLFGGLVFTGVAIVLVQEFEQRRVMDAVIITMGVILEIIVCIVLARYICCYPFIRLFFGTDYYRYYKVIPRILWALELLAIGIYAVRNVMSEMRWKKAVEVAVVVIVFGCGVIFVKGRAQMEKEMVMRYDYCARMQKWGDILKMAREETPTNEISIAALNLALMKTNQIGDHIFNYLQIGTDGLIPRFHRDMTSSMITSEVCFHLGMTNTSQRLSFEAQEAILDFEKSARCQLRLAETTLINGNYETSRKYIAALKKTLFYRKAAERLEKLLYDEKSINAHPIYGMMRKYRLDEDFVFSRLNMVSILGRMVLHEKSNRGAAEYALCWLLMEKNLERFVQLFSLARNAGYQRMPVHFQEAYALAWLNHNGSLKNIPFPVNEQILRRLENFARDMQQNRGMQVIASQYSNTYWFYYQTKKL